MISDPVDIAVLVQSVQ